MKRLLYILPLLFAALVSCEREIPYNGEYEDPKLVIQTSLCAGEDNFICYVNRSYFFLEQTNPNDKEETIKNIGRFTVDIKFGDGVNAELTLEVKPE